jgi:hypothetical protein
MHNYYQEETPTNVTINGEKKIWDVYYRCYDCTIIKVIRKSGEIDYISNDALKSFKGEPACLKVI